MVGFFLGTPSVTQAGKNLLREEAKLKADEAQVQLTEEALGEDRQAIQKARSAIEKENKLIAQNKWNAQKSQKSVNAAKKQLAADQTKLSAIKTNIKAEQAKLANDTKLIGSKSLQALAASTGLSQDQAALKAGNRQLAFDMKKVASDEMRTKSWTMPPLAWATAPPWALPPPKAAATAATGPAATPVTVSPPPPVPVVPPTTPPPAETFVPTWIFCAKKNSPCMFTGTKSVRIRSATNPSAAIVFTDTGGTMCSTAKVGDPAPRDSLICEFQMAISYGGSGPINVQQFGAVGDGVTNDTDAFYAASLYTANNGGGVLNIPTATYIVGHQKLFPGAGYGVEKLIRIENATSPVTINGNNATLRAANGLKFGSFNPTTGQAYFPPWMPFYGRNYGTSSIIMFNLRGNSSVSINNLELDGNSGNFDLGGKYGDTGWQLGSVGVMAYDNLSLTVQNIYTHHHGSDGIIVGAYNLITSSRPQPAVLDSVISDFNGRQGLSWVGGNSLTVTNSRFTNTGQGILASKPGAGVDIEAENSINRNAVFDHCEFSNNFGVGVVADTGDSANILIQNSVIWGTKNWAVWPHKPYMAFVNDQIHGPIVHAYGSDTEPASATQFVNSTIDDYTSPIYGPSWAGGGYLFNFGSGGTENVTFNGCYIHIRNNKGLYGRATYYNSINSYENPNPADAPWMEVIGGATYRNVTFTEHYDTPPSQPIHLDVQRGDRRSGVLDHRSLCLWLSPVGHVRPDSAGKLPTLNS